MGVVCSATMSATSGAERIVECTLESDYSLGVLRLAITAGGTHQGAMAYGYANGEWERGRLRETYGYAPPSTPYGRAYILHGRWGRHMLVLKWCPDGVVKRARQKTRTRVTLANTQSGPSQDSCEKRTHGTHWALGTTVAHPSPMSNVTRKCTVASRQSL